MSDVLFAATVKDDNLAQLWDTLATVTGSTVGELMRERSGMMGRYLASATQPVVVDGENSTGDTNAARKIGQRAALRTLRQMFTRVRAFAAVRGRTDLVRVTAMSGKTFYAERPKCIADAKQLQVIHRQHRRFGGKKPSQNGFLVLSTIYDSYEKTIMARVGWAKSGFMSAASAIPGAKGLTQVPAWMRQPAPGSADDRTDNESNPTFFLTNDVPYVSEILSDRYLARAESSFETSLASELRRRIRYLTKNA